ncbi:MAG: hypothetical protein ACF8XB_20780 [Planctomycetota bacterium JB042]
MEVVALSRADEPRVAPLLRRLERGIRYPLGADRFEIDHGDDPFRFFRRLGEARTFAAFEDGRLAGVLTAVLRSIPTRDGGRRDAHYLCDLKAAPGRRGARVLRPLAEAFEAHAPPDAPAYGVSMNAADGSNRLVRLAPRLFDGVRAAAALRLYSLDAPDATVAAPLLADRFGRPPTWASLAGVKEIVLESTGRPMPLLHAQVGPLAADGGRSAPVEGASHMFCHLAGDPLEARLRDAGLVPSAGATVLARGLDDVAFDFVLTSDV